VRKPRSLHAEIFSAPPAGRSRFASFLGGTHSCFSLPWQPAHAHTCPPARNVDGDYHGYEQQLVGSREVAGAVAMACWFGVSDVTACHEPVPVSSGGRTMACFLHARISAASPTCLAKASSESRLCLSPSQANHIIPFYTSHSDSHHRITHVRDFLIIPGVYFLTLPPAPILARSIFGCKQPRVLHSSSCTNPVTAIFAVHEHTLTILV
jgi:hypothetical protein